MGATLHRYATAHEAKYRDYLFDMSYLEAFGVYTGVGVDVQNFSESEQDQVSQSEKQERSRCLKNVTPLISGSC